jgi:hypothetical protein
MSCSRDLVMGSIEKVLSEVAPDDPQFKDPKVDCTSAFCRTLVLAIRPDGFQKSAVRMRSYGGECHDPFNAKISQVAYAILAAPRILPSLNINGISYAEASKWNNPTAEAVNEASNIWPRQLINLISIGTGIEDTQPPSEQRSSLIQLLLGQAKMESPDSKLFNWAFELSRISERIHEEVSSNYAQEGWQYIRLNIPRGLSMTGQKKWEESMLAFVKEYIESPEIQQKIKTGCCETCVASSNID